MKCFKGFWVITNSLVEKNPDSVTKSLPDAENGAQCSIIQKVSESASKSCVNLKLHRLSRQNKNKCLATSLLVLKTNDSLNVVHFSEPFTLFLKGVATRKWNYRIPVYPMKSCEVFRSSLRN